MSESLERFDDVAILILSCDAYRDVWPYIGESWDRYWQDCPFPIYLVSEIERFEHSLIENLCLGRKVGWSNMLLESLALVEHDHIIYLQDDYLLKGRTDSRGLAQLLHAFESLEADYLRLFPWPSAPEPLPSNPDIGIVDVDQPYRTSLQAAVWRKTTLQDLLRAGESGHQFEENSPGRAAKQNYNFLGVYDPDVTFHTMNTRRYVIDYYSTAVFQGKWLDDAIDTLEVNGISIDPFPRGVLNRWDYWLFKQRLHGPDGARVQLLSFVDRLIFKRPVINHALSRVILRRWRISRWLVPVSDEATAEAI